MGEQKSLEDGNAFEADVVEGVEDAKTPDVFQVKTREVPEDAFPASTRTMMNMPRQRLFRENIRRATRTTLP